MSTKDLEGTYWYCQKHHVAEVFPGCGSHQKIGPFDTEAAAANALQTIADRERRYDAEDSKWAGGA